jgi:hypothetical protein
MSHATIMLSGLAGLIKRAKAPGNAELGNVPKTGTRYPHHEDIVSSSNRGVAEGRANHPASRLSSSHELVGV